MPTRQTEEGEAAWWEKDQRFLARIRRHPCHYPLVADIYRNKTEGYAAIARLREAGRVRYNYRVQLLARGRPHDAWCEWAVKLDTLKSHELPISYLCLRGYPEFDWTRGYGRVHKTIRPDAETPGCFWEYESGEKSERQVREGWKQRYKDVTDSLMIVAPTRELVEWLRSIGDQVADIAWYATLGDCLTNPYGEIWTDFHGNTETLEKPAVFSGKNEPQALVLADEPAEELRDSY